MALTLSACGLQGQIGLSVAAGVVQDYVGGSDDFLRGATVGVITMRSASAITSGSSLEW